MRTIVVVIAALAVGCKGKPTTEAPPVNVGPGSAPAASGSDQTLPERTSTPPAKTTTPIDAAKLKELSEITFPGFTAGGKVLKDKLMVVIHKTTSKPNLAAGVTIKPCTECIPMDLEKWQANPKIKELLPLDLQSHPDTHFEIGKTDVNGEPMIFTYQYGMNFTTDESGPHGRYSNAYILHYNDGVNSIRIVAEYKDLPTKTLKELIELTPREDLEKIAKAFMDSFTHQW